MMSPLELHVVQWLLAASTVTVLGWVVQYTLSSPWWTDKIGRSFVYKDLFLLLLLIPSCLLQLWPHLLTVTEAFWIEVGVFSGITVVVARRCVTWWRIQPPRPRYMWRFIRSRWRNGGAS